MFCLPWRQQVAGRESSDLYNLLQTDIIQCHYRCLPISPSSLHTHTLQSGSRGSTDTSTAAHRSQHPTLCSQPEYRLWDFGALKNHVKDLDNTQRLPQPLLSCSVYCFSSQASLDSGLSRRLSPPAF